MPAMIPSCVCVTACADVAATACRLLVQLGEPEIGQFGVAAPGNQDVFGFDVTVQHARLMRRRQSRRQLPRVTLSIPTRHVCPTYPVAQRAPVDKFGDQILASIEFSAS